MKNNELMIKLFHVIYTYNIVGIIIFWMQKLLIYQNYVKKSKTFKKIWYNIFNICCYLNKNCTVKNPKKNLMLTCSSLSKSNLKMCMILGMVKCRQHFVCLLSACVKDICWIIFFNFSRIVELKNYFAFSSSY